MSLLSEDIDAHPAAWSLGFTIIDLGDYEMRIARYRHRTTGDEWHSVNVWSKDGLWHRCRLEDGPRKGDAVTQALALVAERTA